MDRLRTMEIFVRTVELGSFNAAADEAGISATMVAKHVRDLERRLGGTLLHKTTRRQTLTELGKFYSQSCRSILSGIAETDREALELMSEPRGRLRIGTPVHFGANRLIPVLSRFAQIYPQIEISLISNDHPGDWMTMGVEVAFRIGDLTDQALIAQELTPLRMIYCASPGYIAKRGVPSSPEELSEHNCIGYGEAERAVEWIFEGDQTPCRYHLPAGFRATDCDVVRMAAVHDIGIAQLAESLVKADLDAGRLRQILPDYEAPARPIWLLYHPEAKNIPRVRAFINLTKEMLGETRAKRGFDHSGKLTGSSHRRLSPPSSSV